MSVPNIIPVHAMVEHYRRRLEPLLKEREACRGLIVGCGNGDEAVYLGRPLKTGAVVGIDLDARFSPLARAESCVARGDALRLPFADLTFHFAAAFHSLEHVADPRAALDEVHRVLRPGAHFYVGVPNRHRLVGYVGSFDATTWQKITRSLIDWRARLTGRFKNEAGAHVGFGREELLGLLGERLNAIGGDPAMSWFNVGRRFGIWAWRQPTEKGHVNRNNASWLPSRQSTRPGLPVRPSNETGTRLWECRVPLRR